MNTTLNEIRDCLIEEPDSWNKLISSLGKTESDDEPLSFIKILDVLGIQDASWCLLVLPEYTRNVMEFKLKCARRVEMNERPRAKLLLDVVEKFINGQCSAVELRKERAIEYAGRTADAAADAAAASATAYSATLTASASAYSRGGFAASEDAAVLEREYQARIFRELFE